jgi:hypothetical protein
MNKLEEAVNALELAVQLEPKNINFLYNRALLYRHTVSIYVCFVVVNWLCGLFISVLSNVCCIATDRENSAKRLQTTKKSQN